MSREFYDKIQLGSGSAFEIIILSAAFLGGDVSNQFLHFIKTWNNLAVDKTSFKNKIFGTLTCQKIFYDGADVFGDQINKLSDCLEFKGYSSTESWCEISYANGSAGAMIPTPEAFAVWLSDQETPTREGKFEKFMIVNFASRS